MKRQSKHLFAVVRIDEDRPEGTPWEFRVTVKEVVMTKDEACREVARLNEVNKGKQCCYFWQITRMVDR